MADQSVSVAVDFDVVIVGLGPVGAITANLLGQEGHSVLIVEQNDGSGLRPRAGGFDDENLRLLQGVGLVEEFMSTSNNMPMGPEDSPGSVHAVNLGGNTTRNGDGYGYRGFYQPRFEESLRRGLRRFRTVTTRLSTRCLGIAQTTDHAIVELQRDHGSWRRTPGDEAVFESKPEGEVETVRCKFVIGSDGAHSKVRKAMGVELIDSGYTERWWATDLKLHDEKSLWGKKLPKKRSSNDLKRAWGIVPLWRISGRGTEGRHIRFEFRVEPGDEETYGGNLQSEERLRNLVANWLDPEDYELVRWAMYHFRGQLAEKWRQGRLFLAGDACHTMPPYMGQGLNQGFKDAANLSWKLSAVLHGLAPMDFLDTYWEEREPIANKVVQNSILVGQTVQRLQALGEKKEAKQGTRTTEGQKKSGRAASASEMEARKQSRSQGLAELGGDFMLMASRIKQRTHGSKPYPRLDVDSGKTRLTGETFPQIRVYRLGSSIARRLDDAVAGSRSYPAFVLFAVSQDGAAPILSASSCSFLEQHGGSVFRLALGPEPVAPGCEYHAGGDLLAERFFSAPAPFAALMRPDRIVLGAAHIDHAEALVDELRRYLSGEPPTGKL